MSFRTRSAFALLLAVTAFSGERFVAAVPQTPAATPQSGEALYRDNCASCHEAGVPRAVPRASLSRLSPESIRFALTQGPMTTQASKLTPADIDSVVRFIAAAAAPSAAAAGRRTPRSWPSRRGPLRAG